MDYKGETVKHVSNQLLINILYDGKWNEAKTIVHNDETYAKIKDPKGNLPLHLAVKFGSNFDLISSLLIAYPKSIQIPDPDGNLPLHLASRHHKTRLWIDISKITTHLYNCYPKAIKEYDRKMNLPLHLAIRYRGPDDLIRFLIKESPESIKVKDKFGNLPIHLALQFQASAPIVILLLKMYPESTIVRNKNGGLPLHKAAQFNVEQEIFECVLNADTRAASTKDNRGNFPLHLLFLFCGGPPTEDILKLILGVDPTSLSATNNDGCTPFMMMNRPQEHYVDDYI